MAHASTPRSSRSGRAARPARADADRARRLLADIAAAFDRGANRVVRRAGPRWGAFELRAPIARGAFGEVWHAFDPHMHRSVALKLQAGDVGACARSAWLEEARRIARIRDPHVVECHGCAVHDGRAGLWLEFVDGCTLADAFECGRSFDLACGLDIATALARALTAVHAAGLLHADVKPANLMLARDGRVVLVDFGSAGTPSELAARPLVQATRAFLAPEVAAGADQTIASDLYAFGGVLRRIIERVAGTAPARGIDRHVLVRAAALADACLAVDASRRPDDASTVVARLVRLRAPIPGSPVGA